MYTYVPSLLSLPPIPPDFPCGSPIKNLPAMQETQVRSLYQEDILEKGMATPSTRPPSFPSRSSESSKLSPLCYTELPTSRLFHTWQCIYSVLLSHFIPSSSLSTPCPSVHSLHLHLYSCPTNRFICTIFLDSIYMS